MPVPVLVLVPVLVPVPVPVLVPVPVPVLVPVLVPGSWFLVPGARCPVPVPGGRA